MNSNAVSTQSGLTTQSNPSPGGDAGSIAKPGSPASGASPGEGSQVSIMNSDASKAGSAQASASETGAGQPQGDGAGVSSPGNAASPAAQPAVSLVIPTGVRVRAVGSARATTGEGNGGWSGLLAAEQRLESTLPGSTLGQDPQVMSTFGRWKQLTVGYLADRRLIAQLKVQLRQLTARSASEKADCRAAAGVCRSAANAAANGDHALLAEAGFQVAKSPATASPPDAPPDFTAKPGPRAGTVVLDWGSVPRAKRFAAMQSFDPVTGASWHATETKVRRRVVLKGLPPGQKMSFRLAAFGANDQQGPWSDIVSVIVPLALGAA